jgi:hypothetical protein
LLHKAVLAQCDMDDGVKDGIVGNPPACKFDPSKLLCKVGDRGSCLSPDQLDAIRKIYSGPVTPKGDDVYIGGAMPGSELADFMDELEKFHGDPLNIQFTRPIYPYPTRVMYRVAATPMRRRVLRRSSRK